MGLVYKQSSEEPAGLSVEMLVLLVGQVVSRIKMTSQVLGVRVQIHLEGSEKAWKKMLLVF